MGRNSPKILEDFVIPHLEGDTFGYHLKWENEAQRIFLLRWSHKSGPKWTIQDSKVFVAWDSLKRRSIHTGKDYDTAAKQRFRSALRKKIMEKKLIELKQTSKEYKRFQILPDDLQVIINYPDSPLSSGYGTDLDITCKIKQLIESSPALASVISNVSFSMVITNDVGDKDDDNEVDIGNTDIGDIVDADIGDIGDRYLNTPTYVYAAQECVSAAVVPKYKTINSDSNTSFQNVLNEDSNHLYDMQNVEVTSVQNHQNICNNRAISQMANDSSPPIFNIQSGNIDFVEGWLANGGSYLPR